MFWGVIIDSGKNFSTVLKNSLHIAMAAIVSNSNDNDKNTIYPVYIKSNNGQNILVCNLSKQNLQVGLDLMFDEGEKLVISTTASGAKIHISGSVINSAQDANRDVPISRNIDLAVNVKPGKAKSDSASLLSAIQQCKQADRNIAPHKKRKGEETSNVFTKKAKVSNEKNVKSNEIGNEINSKKPELLSSIDEEDDDDSFPLIETDDEDEDTEDEDGNIFGDTEDEDEDEDEDEEDEDDDDDDEDDEDDEDEDEDDEDEDEMLVVKRSNSKQATLKLNKNKQKTPDNSAISAAVKTPQKDSSKLNGQVNKLTPKNKNQQQTPNKQKNNLGTPNQSILKSPKPETENQQKKTPKKPNQNTSGSQQSASKLSQSAEGGKPGKAQNQQTPKKQNQNAKTPYQDTPKPPVHKGDSADSTVKKTLPGGLVVEDLKLGNGVEAKSGKMVSVQYTGRLKSTNKIFDQTPNGRPFNFVLGKGEVIKGWDMGLAGMKVGSKRRLTIPPPLGYGNKGSMPIIPPNSTLVFEVELKSVK